jgi:transcriptional regulator with XRE-family HTH domain
MREILLILGQRIRNERERRGMSQEGFANLSGLHRTEVGLLEKGRITPRLDTLLLISHRLGLSVSELLQRIEPWVRRSRKLWWLTELRKTTKPAARPGNQQLNVAGTTIKGVAAKSEMN